MQSLRKYVLLCSLRAYLELPCTTSHAVGRFYIPTWTMTYNTLLFRIITFNLRCLNRQLKNVSMLAAFAQKYRPFHKKQHSYSIFSLTSITNTCSRSFFYMCYLQNSLSLSDIICLGKRFSQTDYYGVMSVGVFKLGYF